MKRLLLALTLVAAVRAAVPTPEAYFGFKIGADRKLARWDKMVSYFQAVSAQSDRVKFRNLGPTTNGNPFVLLEISSAENLRNLDRIKALERKLYFQGGAPTAAEREDILHNGKAVVFITNAIHSTEIGATQMVIELVHRLATDNSEATKKELDNVVLLLVPCLNPDGQILVTDWYNKTLGTPSEASPLPELYHHYTGHDNNRDMYLFSQKESQMAARVLWHEWFPSIWLDEHQQGTSGPRIFTMPATDPINPNVDPLIYRLNGMFGQSQAAALEAEGKTGIIFNSTYTNFWQGAMAWAGWWHNQVGLLTEVASVRIATPTTQQVATPGVTTQSATGGRSSASGPAGGASEFEGERRRAMENPDAPLPPPRDTTARTEYPRPWLGGHWSLRDIVDYELTATDALLESAADSRETLLKQIYSINRNTIELGRKGQLGQDKEKAFAVLISPVQHDPNEAIELVDKLMLGGVEVSRATAAFTQDGKQYPGGHVRDPFRPGIRALREGSAGEADLPRGAPLSRSAGRSAVRCLRLVAGHAVRRQDRVRPHRAARVAGAREDDFDSEIRPARGIRRRQLVAFRVQRRTLRHDREPAAQGRSQSDPEQVRRRRGAVGDGERQTGRLDQSGGGVRCAQRRAGSEQNAQPRHHAQRAARGHLPVLRPFDG